MLQLARVARQPQQLERVDELRAGAERLSVSTRPTMPVEEVFDQRLDVLRPLSQRREADGERVESVKEVFAEAALPHKLLKVSVGRGDDADVHVHFAVVAHAEHAPLLYDTQELRL